MDRSRTRLASRYIEFWSRQDLFDWTRNRLVRRFKEPVCRHVKTISKTLLSQSLTIAHAFPSLQVIHLN